MPNGILVSSTQRVGISSGNGVGSLPPSHPKETWAQYYLSTNQSQKTNFARISIRADTPAYSESIFRLPSKAENTSSLTAVSRILVSQ